MALSATSGAPKTSMSWRRSQYLACKGWFNKMVDWVGKTRWALVLKNCIQFGPVSRQRALGDTKPHGLDDEHWCAEAFESKWVEPKASSISFLDQTSPAPQILKPFFLFFWSKRSMSIPPMQKLWLLSVSLPPDPSPTELLLESNRPLPNDCQRHANQWHPVVIESCTWGENKSSQLSRLRLLRGLRSSVFPRKETWRGTYQ